MSIRHKFWLASAAAACVAAAATGAAYSRRKRNLAGRVVLLTGGSRGLGLQLARELGREGCKLILVARSMEELNSAAEELRGSGTEVSFLTCDLSSGEELKGMLEHALGIYGQIDIVVNNAGAIAVGPIDSLTERDFHEAMDLMFWAPVRIVLGLLPHLLSRGDVDVVNISSIGGRISVPHLLPYSSAKFALCGFSEGLDAELRNRGVHVLTVTPGLMRTGSHKQAEFTGNAEKEYLWFALGATLPGAAMNVKRAARQIVSALKRRRHTLTLTWGAQVAARLHGAFPETAQAIAAAANRVLPSPSSTAEKKKGNELHAEQPAVVKALTILGETAERSQRQKRAAVT